MAAHIGVQFAHVDAVGIEFMKNLRIAFFEQGHHQVLGTDVILVVVAALLLGDTQDS